MAIHPCPGSGRKPGKHIGGSYYECPACKKHISTSSGVLRTHGTRVTKAASPKAASPSDNGTTCQTCGWRFAGARTIKSAKYELEQHKKRKGH